MIESRPAVRTKLVACDPCRYSKVACDHGRPFCTRCVARHQAEICKYRPAPFKRSQKRSASSKSTKKPQRVQDIRAEPKSNKSSNYPNPGYLGSSSHSTLFQYIQPSNETTNRQLANQISDGSVLDGSELIDTIHRSCDTSSSLAFVEVWLTKGVNLVLAGPFMRDCLRTVQYTFHELEKGSLTASEISKRLFENSARDLVTTHETALEEYCRGFSFENVRWETLGLFFSAVVRAAVDVTQYEPLFKSHQERIDFQKHTLLLSDRCLDFCISIDRLNDMQLILQYENFINHTFVHGDQSYHSWSRLGSVASSLFALGYHENITGDGQVPVFLKDLRKMAFARAYSADKNVAIFLGRPPRILRKYCRFQLPRHDRIYDENDNSTSLYEVFPFEEDASFDYTIETQWSALCASLKEDILEHSRKREPNEDMRIVLVRAGAQWQRLPLQFRLEQALASYDRPAVVRDFMTVHNTGRANDGLIEVSAEMLHLIVEAMLLKDQLTFSGTSIVWKVTYYGLSAAGVLCVLLLNHNFPAQNANVSRSQVFKDLSVLVAEVKTGALAAITNPNYALLMRATQSIEDLLDRLINRDVPSRSIAPNNEDISVDNQARSSAEQWEPWVNTSLWDFEQNFWTNFYEHPFMHEPDLYANDAV